MEDWKLSVCNQATTVSISDINNYTDAANFNLSPIDSFYSARDSILRACDPNFAANHPSVSPLFLVGLISSVENYYRDIISSLIRICPISKEKSSEKTINLASLWFGSNNLEKGALENISFSDYRNIQKNFKSLFNIDVDNDSSQISAPLKEFSRLCELRHAIVHSAGQLSGKNAVKLNLPNSLNAVQVVVKYAQLQEAAAVCTSLICASNLELYKLMSNRWLHVWPKTPTYISSDLNMIFNKLWEIFYSNIDSKNGLISVPLSRIKARNRIIKSKGM
ncbi:hypothetical protein [Flagellimonas sp. 2504JD1-5]